MSRKPFMKSLAAFHSDLDQIQERHLMKKSEKREKYLVVALILTIFGSALLWLMNYDAPGIVLLPGYEHAVAICEWDDRRDHELDQVDDVMYTWAKGGIMYTVNWGHLADPEVKQLEKLASVHCEQYFNPTEAEKRPE